MRVLHVDDALIVVDKPAGLLSVPGRGADKQDCAASRAQQLWPDALVVHRLDQATSGLLLMARGLTAQRALSRAFEQGHIAKDYVAVVHGLVAADTGRIDLPLAADWPNRPRQRVDAVAGKPSVTRWQVLTRDVTQCTTRLALSPQTGRTHQLRVHLQAIGHPIVGDRLYGTSAEPDRVPARMLLHAGALRFAHPGSGEPVGFESPPPF
jgi:tRNA pseudouridine32 synthase / 23S rRNA pseudouridine746 synthase